MARSGARARRGPNPVLRRALALAVTLATPLATAGQISWAPPRPRQTTIVSGTVRPFFHVFGPGGGAISHLRAAHYFERPLVLSLEVAPLALVLEHSGGGAIAHVRAHAAYVVDVIEIGAGVGGRVQRWGQNGMSVAASLRLGSLDGLHFGVEYVHSLVENYYTGRRNFSFSNASGRIAVPLGARTVFEVEGGLGFDFWTYGTVGLRYRVHGEGGRGTLDVRAGAGAAWIVDRFPCQYQDPTPCVGAAGAMGPTLSFGMERRF